MEASDPTQTEQTPAASSPAAPPPPAGSPPAPDEPASSETGQPPAPSSGDLAAEVDALRAQLSELAQKASSGQLTAAPTDSELERKVSELREQFATWPGDEHADSPQPWDLKAHGLPQPGVTRDHLPGGQPDEISPVVIAHGKPLLTAGMAGDYVTELAALLKTAGYETSISQGTNHSRSFDDTVTAAVNSFKRDFHVLEDPSQWNNDLQAAERFVGPHIWEALLRVADRVKAAA